MANTWLAQYLGGPKDGEGTRVDAELWTRVSFLKPAAERFVDRHDCCITHHYFFGVYTGPRSTQDDTPLVTVSTERTAPSSSEPHPLPPDATAAASSSTPLDATMQALEQDLSLD